MIVNIESNSTRRGNNRQSKERKLPSMVLRKRSEFSLIVRMWQVETDAGESTWRGSIGRIPDGDPVYFQTLESLLMKIAGIVGDVQNEFSCKTERGENDE